MMSDPRMRSLHGRLSIARTDYRKVSGSFGRDAVLEEIPLLGIVVRDIETKVPRFDVDASMDGNDW
jgi:hypothetical protein